MTARGRSDWAPTTNSFPGRRAPLFTATEIAPKHLDHSGAACAEIVNMAKRELGAFMTAIEEVHGFEQARVSGEDWLEELELMDSLPGPTPREWRLVTIAAAVRLAERICRCKA